MGGGAKASRPPKKDPVLWFCIASGPSLTQEDCDLVRHLPCITVNDAYKFAPWANAHYAADKAWWDVHRQGVRKCRGAPYTARQGWGEDILSRSGITGMDVKPLPGLSERDGVLHAGRNSGYQAINLAYLMGATRIGLLGYDMQGGGHFFGRHPKSLRQNSDYSVFRAAFRTIQPHEYGIEIWNCTRDTGLDAFPCRSLESVLSEDIFGQEGVSELA